MTRLGWLLLLAAGLAWTGCGDSDSDGSSLATVRGTLTLHGEWPSQGEIQVSLFSAWHTELPLSLAPQGPPEFHTEALSSPTPDGTTHLVAFEIADINPGSYPSLVVGWRNGGVMGLDEPVLGLYGANLAVGDSLPAPITLAAGDEMELAFEGWLDRVPDTDVELEPGRVAGVVEFTDSWPSAFPFIYVVFMSSSDPATPSNPGPRLQAVTPASPEFSIEVGAPTTGHLAVYGFPYTVAWDAYYGGYGWDWDAATPALTTLTLLEGQSGLGGLVLSCRSNRD